jgi:hypothetical protein
MIMNGYPDAGARLYVNQQDIYDWMELNQVEPAPYKAPPMVRDAIHHFNDPPGTAHFVANHSPDAETIMYWVLLWMRRTDYPAAVMIKGNHWVVITGYETDVDPETSATVTLNSIDINDPYPPCG